MEIEIREITTLHELEQMQKVEEAVWRDLPTPIHQTYTAYYNGGVIIGAFVGEEMIGFQYSFAGFDGKKTYLCSHSLAVLPEYRSKGLGEKLKLKQAEVAANKGYKMMTWTFDPLESVNAYLNLHKLGGEVVAYKENHYGDLDDGLNTGLATDRFLVEWYFLEQKMEWNVPLDSTKVLLEVKDDHTPQMTDNPFSSESDVWFVAIPGNIQEIKVSNMQLAIEWRKKTREVFHLLLDNGYKGRDLIRSNGKSYYCFAK